MQEKRLEILGKTFVRYIIIYIVSSFYRSFGRLCMILFEKHKIVIMIEYRRDFFCFYKSCCKSKVVASPGICMQIIVPSHLHTYTFFKHPVLQQKLKS